MLLGKVQCCLLLCLALTFGIPKACETTMSIPGKSNNDVEETCTLFWATATTVRVMQFHNRTLLRDRSQIIGESIGSIAWEPRSSSLLWSDYISYPFIASMNFTTGWPEEIWKRESGSKQHLNLDWSTGNLYVMDDYALDVVKYTGPNTYTRARIALLDGVDFVVHPKSGFVFWTQISETANKYNVMRSWLDGSQARRVISDVGPGLTFDYLRDILYVTNGYSLVASDLNGRFLRHTRPMWANGSYVNSEYTQIATWGDALVVESRNKLLYVDTATERAHVVALKGEQKTRDFKVYCHGSLPDLTTPCTSENGKCGTHQICLHTPAGVAKCYSHKRWL